MSPESAPFFLPGWPPELSELARLALLLLVALVAGELGRRHLRLPSLVGQVAAGIALGPQLLGFVDAAGLIALRPVMDLALGLLLFELGGRIDVQWLKRNPWLLATSVAEGALCFVAVLVTLRWLGIAPLPAALAACMLIATSPSVVTLITAELKAQGQVTERVRLFTALDCTYAVVALAMLHAWLNAEYSGDPLSIVLHPVYLLCASFLLAVFATGLLHGALRLVGRLPGAETLCLLVSVALVVAAAEALATSMLLSLLAFGALARNTWARRRTLSLDFGLLGILFALVLFAVSGALLEFSGDWRLWGAAAAVIVARQLGKTAATAAFALPSGVGLRKGVLTGIGLAPMSGLAIVMVRDTLDRYPALDPALGAVVLAAVALMQLLGPVMTQSALIEAREAAPDDAGGAPR